MTTTMTATWYRNAGARRWHLAAEDWIRSGKAECVAGSDRTDAFEIKRATPNAATRQE